jgi:hypothetical protein
MIDGGFDQPPVSSNAMARQGFTKASDMTKPSIYWEDAKITDTDAMHMHSKRAGRGNAAH